MQTDTLPREAQPVPTVARAFPRLYADLEELLAAPDTGFEAGFSAFVRQLEEAFRVEEEWIEDRAWATIKEHRELHAEVLSLMHHALARNLAGDYSLARKVIQLLPTWFNSHIPHVDQPMETMAAQTG
jgi:hemerythrin